LIPLKLVKIRFLSQITTEYFVFPAAIAFVN
jgi:hypothetical protein